MPSRRKMCDFQMNGVRTSSSAATYDGTAALETSGARAIGRSLLRTRTSALRFSGLSILAASVAMMVIALSNSTALAQSGNGYDLGWAGANGGGGTSSGNGWSVEGTAAHPAAAKSARGDWAVQGGFWNRVTGNLSPVA